jgi:hypothetical protein
MVALLTAAGVQAAPVAGSVVSVRHAHSHPDVVNTTVGEATVVAPDLICAAKVRVPASDFWAKARVVTAITCEGVEAIEPMP